MRKRQILTWKLRSTLCCLLLFWLTTPLEAQNHWDFNKNPYESYMTISGYVVKEGAELAGDQYEIGCFIENECRGKVRLQASNYQGHSHLCFLPVWGSTDDNGKRLYLFLYDHLTQEEYKIDSDILYQYDGSIGESELYRFSVNASPLYTLQLLPTENGSMTINSGMAIEQDEIRLILTPAPGCVLETVSGYKTGDASSPIPLSGSGESRTFTMPAHDVTITASFRKTKLAWDAEAIAEAKMIIENTEFLITQEEGNTEAAVKEWLINTINTLLQETGVSVSADNVVLSHFSRSVTGTEENRLGRDGRFDFAVILSKGELSDYTDSIRGKIEASVYTVDLEEVPSLRLQVVASDQGLLIRNLTKGEPIRIYNIQGLLVHNEISDDNEAFVTLRNRGVYIIQTDSELIKTIF